MDDDPLREAARAVLAAAWDPAGYTAPNPERYPWQWLWDSCFHAIAWTALGDERGVEELGRVLRGQDDDGFIAHVRYDPHPSPHAAFWGRTDTSSITQPPMHGHALAELARRGVDVGDELVERSARALRFLLERRPRHASGLVPLCHPWESGADDSPRWDHWFGLPRDPGVVYRVKGALLDAIERSPGGAPLRNAAFDVAPASFNALVAFNAAELAGLTGDRGLADEATSLTDALEAQWDDEARTWVDAGEAAAASGRVRTLDALLPTLVSPDEERVAEVLTQLVDSIAFGAAFGPTGVHRDEPTFEPASYWRGSSWPQLSYLLWVAARRAGNLEIAATLAGATTQAVATSGFAEHWNPDTAAALGARPQSWATLAIVMGE